MAGIRILAACTLLAATLSAEQETRKAPVASNPVVTVKGKITKVNLGAREGMPYAEIEFEGKALKVYLGAMHHLMTHQFNPRAGQTLEARGYQMGADVMGIQATLVEENRTIRLRDENGFPLWRRNHSGGRGGDKGGGHHHGKR